MKTVGCSSWTMWAISIDSGNMWTMCTQQPHNETMHCNQCTQSQAEPMIKSPWCLVMVCSAKFLWAFSVHMFVQAMVCSTSSILKTCKTWCCPSATLIAMATCKQSHSLAASHAQWATVKHVNPLVKSNNVLLHVTTHRTAWSTVKTTTCFHTLLTIQLSNQKHWIVRQLVPVDTLTLWTTLANIQAPTHSAVMVVYGVKIFCLPYCFRGPTVMTLLMLLPIKFNQRWLAPQSNSFTTKTFQELPLLPLPQI